GDGKVITDFGSSYDNGFAVALQADGKIVAAGVSYQGVPLFGGTGFDFALARYNSDGSLDTTFDGDGKVTTPFGPNDGALAVATKTDGKIVSAGSSYQSGTSNDFAVVRYKSDGSLDTGFGAGGMVTTDFSGPSWDYGEKVAIQADGKIVVAGLTENAVVFQQLTLARYESDGSLDSSFGVGGKIVISALGGASALAIQADGKILVGSTVNNYSSGTGFDFALM